jgi:hypothetical protein
MACPYCLSQTSDDALVCLACSRDIAVPASLIAERDDLLRKRDVIRDQLRKAHQEIETIMKRRELR